MLCGVLEVGVVGIRVILFQAMSDEGSDPGFTFSAGVNMSEVVNGSLDRFFNQVEVDDKAVGGDRL